MGLQPMGRLVGAICAVVFAAGYCAAGLYASARVGAAAYNLTHSYLGALALLVGGIHAAQPLAISLGLIWLAHIGFDRALGYGLKYNAGFAYTHLGWLKWKAS